MAKLTKRQKAIAEKVEANKIMQSKTLLNY